MGATSSGEQRLRSKSDFQRFCADLRKSSPSLDELVEALRALATSELRPAERVRFATPIAKHLGASFPAPDVRAVAAQEWPPEIAMALRGHAPAQGEPAAPAPERSPERSFERLPERLSELLPERFEAGDLRELSGERGSPLTVVLMGDEDEHRASIERLKALGLRCVRESSLQGLRDAFDRDAMVGLVVGASSWPAGDPRPRQRLRNILALSNLCWVKLVRCPAWASVEHELPELCMSLHFAEPPRTRLAVEEQATITNAELRGLTDAIKDLTYGERVFSYDVQPSLAQKRILRAATSRYLRDRYAAVYKQEPGFHVRTLANRGDAGLVSLVSVGETDVAFVVKVSPYPVALEEARRFQAFAHGTSLKMEFFCHGPQGALVLTPIDDTRLGQARSLDDMLASRELVGRPEHDEGISAIRSAIAALQRFSQKLRPEGVTMFCGVEREETETLLARCGSIVVAGQAIHPRQLYEHGRKVLDRCSSHAIVHGDAHPGNVLFSASNTAILIDFECAGLGPACYDVCMLGIHVLARRFVAVGDEGSTVGLFRDLLAGVPFAELVQRWAYDLRFAASHEAVYLAHEAIAAGVAMMVERGCTRDDVYGIVAIILCRELLNQEFQQFTIRCALAAISSLLSQHPG